MRRSEATRLLGFGLSALVPAGLLLALILSYGVDVPFWDQWGVAPFFIELSRGSLSVADLFEPQNEYVQFFPHLIFVGLGWLTRWDVRAEMLVSFLLACLVSFGVYRLGKITVGGAVRQRLCAFLVSSLLIFSPIQYENWLFGIQVVYFVPVACVVACLVVAGSGLGASAKFLLCMLLATVSTFSSANGVLCWVVAPPALAAALTRGELKGRAGWAWGAAWAGGLALNVALYLYGLERPPVSGREAAPLDALTYFLAFLGGPLALGRRPLLVALPLGAALAALFAAACLYVLLRRDTRLTRRATAWLMLGAFSVLTASLVTYGRAGYGVGQALSSRYTTFSIYLMVALAHLAPIIVGDLRARGSAAAPLVGRLAAAAALALVLAYPLVTALVVRHGMRPIWRERLHLKACLLLAGVVEDECGARLFTDQRLLRRYADGLDRLGFLRPPLVKSVYLRDLKAGGGAGPYGSFDRLERDGEGRGVASGRARLPRRAADAVLLTYEAGGGEAIIFAVAEVGARRDGPPDVWRKTISLGKLPAGKISFSAWAFDSLEGKAYKLDGTHEVP